MKILSDTAWARYVKLFMTYNICSSAVNFGTAQNQEFAISIFLNI